VETGPIIQKITQTMKFLLAVMAQDLLTTYKYGWKTSYYQNTYDHKTDEVEDESQHLSLLDKNF
jgi:ribonucleoside-diphosphate reductase alpha chain